MTKPDTVLQEWFITTPDDIFGMCVLLGPFINDYNGAVKMVKSVREKIHCINPNAGNFEIKVVN